ncbi:hypothetical protein [Rehaibacterium terrae]|jgi:hypothetical protein|uniref:Sel1 repeat family protein n=1 Tax=Rehaibacterium terrae TaxID=1341696 RepID=A0A7W7Y1A1_9GAMM|nr:hypothetical protein [Rehaibacterium terrae]MBB5016251.1 hypothetical protein [Rehaibacterium terrae]
MLRRAIAPVPVRREHWLLTCWLFGLVVLLAAAAPASADIPSDGERLRKAQLLTESFLRYHPDIRYRLEGLSLLDDGEPQRAATAFMRAAKYADKISQAAVAELIWNGALPGRSRAEAYAWMDLAAERGYAFLVAKRERYWAALDADEQQEAIRIGSGLYAEYGDEVAKPRLERLLAKGRRAATGSRVGSLGALQVLVPGPDGRFISVSGDEYYQNRLWQPKDYFAWQDSIWGGMPVGTVTVGDLTPDATGTDEKQN